MEFFVILGITLSLSMNSQSFCEKKLTEINQEKIKIKNQERANV